MVRRVIVDDDESEDGDAGERGGDDGVDAVRGSVDERISDQEGLPAEQEGGTAATGAGSDDDIFVESADDDDRDAGDAADDDAVGEEDEDEDEANDDGDGGEVDDENAGNENGVGEEDEDDVLVSRKSNKRSAVEELDDDDLDLIEENTGLSVKRRSASGEKSFRRLSKKQRPATVVVSNKGDLEEAGQELQQRKHLHRFGNLAQSLAPSPYWVAFLRSCIRPGCAH